MSTFSVWFITILRIRPTFDDDGLVGDFPNESDSEHNISNVDDISVYSVLWQKRVGGTDETYLL